MLAVTGDGNGQADLHFTIDRDASQEREDLELMGLDHPLVVSYLHRYRDLQPGEIGIRVKSHDAEAASSPSGVLSPPRRPRRNQDGRPPVGHR